MPVEFTKLTASQVKLLSPSRTVFLFPVGPLEDHGPHLPLGLDLAEATELCRLAGEKIERDLKDWTAVLMPAAPLGVNTHTRALAFPVRAHVLRDWLVDACRGLIHSGFFHFVCFSGNLGPRQLTAIEDAARIISRKPLRAWFRKPSAELPVPTLCSASSRLPGFQGFQASPFWPDPLEHGGKRDTSVALAIDPNCVGDLYHGMIAQSRKGTFLGRGLARLGRSVSGYWGAPAEATAEAGRTILSNDLDQVFIQLRAVWEGTHPNRLFRSWYSILPPNKSFARSWFLAVMITLLFAVWAFILVDGMPLG